jgi:chromosomal replication initiator protein
MNIASPQEQFASKRRLNAIFRAPPPRRQMIIIEKAPNWFETRCPWPCYADEAIHVELVKQEYVDRQTIRRIAITVARQFEISEGDLYSGRRTHNVVLPRQITMYLAKVCTGRSYPEIGRRLGGKDHTTILHGVRKIEKMMAESPTFASEVNSLRAKLEEGAV